MTSIALPVNFLEVGKEHPTEPSDYIKLTDKKLVELAGKSSDMAAFSELYQRYHRRVYSICLRMMRDPTAAEDLAQDVFIQVFRKLKSFNGNAAFTTWLHRVTVNQVLMHFRKRHVKYETLSGSLLEVVELVTERASSKKINIESTLLIDAALTKLPDGYKRTFFLHDVVGYEHEEVARIMGVSIGTSKSQLHKARLKLRKLIKSKANPRIHQTRTDP